MSWIDGARYRLRSFFAAGAASRDREEEFAAHQSLAAADHAHRTGNLDEARYAAQRDFGNTTYLNEEMRWMGATRWMDAVSQDLRYAGRTLRRSPVVTVVAALSLGLGIGANALFFGMIHSLLLAKLPVTA